MCLAINQVEGQPRPLSRTQSQKEKEKQGLGYSSVVGHLLRFAAPRGRDKRREGGRGREGMEGKGRGGERRGREAGITKGVSG